MAIPQKPICVVTGGASGLGRAFCLTLAKRHAKIAIADIQLEGAEKTAQLVKDAGGEAFAAQCDVRNLKELEQLALQTENTFGPCDVLINNAGVAVSGITGDVPIEDWKWIMDINLWGPIYGCHVFVPRMRARKQGAILNVASSAGLLCAPTMGPYNVTKSAVVGLSETMHGELKEDNIAVTVLCPTFFETNIVQTSRVHAQDQHVKKKRAETMMRRAKLQANDVAQFALNALDRNELYALPHADGRWAWRLKRSNPEFFYHTFAPLLMKRLLGD